MAGEGGGRVRRTRRPGPDSTFSGEKRLKNIAEREEVLNFALRGKSGIEACMNVAGKLDEKSKKIGPVTETLEDGWGGGGRKNQRKRPGMTPSCRKKKRRLG